MGFCGTMPTSVWTNVGTAAVDDEGGPGAPKRLAIESRTAGSRPVPARAASATVVPITAASNVVMRKYASVRPPILPSRRMSPSDVTPTKRLAITSGTTTIVINLMKMVPAGSIQRTTAASAGTARATRRRPRPPQDRRGCACAVSQHLAQRIQCALRHRPAGCHPCGRCERRSAESAPARRPPECRAT